MMKVKRITIIGLGLIGGSLGLALKKKLPELKVCGVDLSAEVVRMAVEIGAIDDGTVQIEQGVAAAEIIFLATPVPEMRQLCAKMVPYLAQGTIVTDMGSTKEKIVELMERSLPVGVTFLGGHPMAGSEKAGIQEAHVDLLENAVYLLTPTTKTPIEVIDMVRSILERLGARIILLSPAEHDRKVAAISHLPHFLASALVDTVGFLEEKEGGFFSLAAGGFRDTTRIAGSQSGMWCDIFLQNKRALLPLLKEFQHILAGYEAALETEDSSLLTEKLEQAKKWRESVPAGLKGILPQIFELTVMVPDQPGVLAELTGLLREEGLNISDIEIQRVREENEGTIRLGFVNKESCERANQVLQSRGYLVYKTGL